MKNNFDLRKFLTENKNITEDKFADSAEEDLIQCVNNLANTRYIDPVEAADEAIAIIEKTFLKNDEDEDMYEEDLDEEVVNEDILTVYAFYNFLLLIGLGATINQAYKKAKEGLFGERAKKMANKFSGVIDKFVDKITEEDIDTSEEVKKK